MAISGPCLSPAATRRLLVSHTANESQPSYSPDGKTLAFVSDRTGGGDIYLLTLATGDLRRLTFEDGNELLDGWSRDGQWIYFTSSSREIAGGDIYRVRVSGGMPMQVSADRFTNEFAAAPSPDGKSLAFSARGNGPGQWWRKGHSHLDESEIWIMKGLSTSSYEKVVDMNGKNYWPMWSGDGRSLYFMSDRSGAENIWMQPLSGQPRQITQFRAGRVVWPDISTDGRTIVFERDFSIWSLDVDSGKAAQVPIRRRGASIGPVTEHLSLNTGFQSLALSPDGRKVAFVARGEIFAASARDGGTAARVTNSLANEAQIMWAPDSRRIVYVSERDDVNHIFMYDFAIEHRDAADEQRERRRRAEVLAGWHDAGLRPRRQIRGRDGPRVEAGARHRNGIHQRIAQKPGVVIGQQVGRVSRAQHAVVPQRVSRAGGRR